MKYRLKKDLPFAKAGQELEEELPIEYNQSVLWYREDMGNNSRQTLCRRFEIPQYIEEGWIEEVKPREWWIAVGTHIGIMTGFESESLAVGYKHQHYKPEDITIVKVREIDG